MEPEYGPFLTGLTFLEWFEQYFLEILAGHNLTSYGYISLKSQQELRKEYGGAVLTEDKLRILAGFHKFTEAEPETIELLLQRDRPEFFAKLMQGEDYWLAHAALQAMSRTPCAELTDTYEWMWKRYEGDRMMRSNLQIAFEANGIEKK